MRFFCLLLLALSLPAQRVLVVGIDGLSTTAVEQAGLKTMQGLMERGAWTLKARGVLPTVSSPNWGSILMGATPVQHGVTSNDWQPDKHEITPFCQGPEGIYPNIFGVLKAAKPALHLAAIHDWDGFGRLFDRGAATSAIHIEKSEKTAAAALQYWREKKPDFLFVHLDDVDHAGHEHGWNTEKYYAEARRVDELLGKLVQASGDALVIVVSDHGGTGTRHGNANMNDLQIPLVLSGKGVKPGEIQRMVNIYDIAPTVTAYLDVPPSPCWIGSSLISNR